VTRASIANRAELAKLAPETFAQLPKTRAFIDRMCAIPDAEISTLSPEQAITLCRNAPGPAWKSPTAFHDATGFSENQAVIVRANNYARDPIHGALVHAGPSEIVLRREDARAGVVYVHFPRVGFGVSAQ
jgi:hypothetical protein